MNFSKSFLKAYINTSERYFQMVAKGLIISSTQIFDKNQSNFSVAKKKQWLKLQILIVRFINIAFEICKKPEKFLMNIWCDWKSNDI